MGWNLRVQYISLITLALAAVILLISVYQNWFIPDKLTLFFLLMMTVGWFAVHIIQQQYKRLKEVTLITTIAIYLVLIISVAIHDIWVWEAVINKQGMTKLSLVMSSVFALYTIFVYYRTKKSNKRVKEHNNKWRVSEKKKGKLNESDDIYLVLGRVYEGSKD